MESYLAALRYAKPDSVPSHRAPPSAAEEDAYYAQFGQPFFDPWVGRVVRFMVTLLTAPRQPAEAPEQPAVASGRQSVRHA